MYLRVIRARTDDEGGTRKHWEAWQRRFGPDLVGAVGVVAGMSPEGAFTGALLFESSDAADYFSRTLVRSPEWTDLAASFDGPYIVEDFSAVDVIAADRWAEAGALQVVHGSMSDGAELLRLARLMAGPIEAGCPDIVASVLGVEGDRFCHLILFVSRAEAEAHESARPDELTELTERWAELVSDLTFLGIDEPWHRVDATARPSPDEDLTRALDALIGRLQLPGATALFTVDGSVVCSAGATAIDPGLLGSLGGDLADRAQTVTIGTGRGPLRYSLASGEGGSVAIAELGRGLSLVVSVPAQARIGMVLYEMESAAADLILFGSRPPGPGPGGQKSPSPPLG